MNQTINEKWEILLSDFRGFGGIAENIVQQEGEYGRGIFPINSKVKTKIFTPSKLLIRKNDIELVNDKIRIKEEKKYGKDVKSFFNFYQDNFSWSRGGKEETEFFENGLRFFSLKLKQLIKKSTLIDLEERHKGQWEEVIKNQFLNSRAVSFEGEEYIAPIWELVNHEVRSLPFIISPRGVSTPNYPPFNGELRHSYNNISSFDRFFSYGFFAKESIIFSFPFSIKNDNHGINFCCKGKTLKDDEIKIERAENNIIIEGLPIADVNNPKLPIDYFKEVLIRIGNNSFSVELFSRILKLNIEMRKSIIHESQKIDNEVSNVLTNLVNYEISLLLADN